MSSTNNTMNKTLTFVSLSSELGAFKKNVDTFFLVIMGSIVFCTVYLPMIYDISSETVITCNCYCLNCFHIVLQAGFAFNESGMARAKNVTSVLFRNYMSSSKYCTSMAIPSVP